MGGWVDQYCLNKSKNNLTFFQRHKYTVTFLPFDSFLEFIEENRCTYKDGRHLELSYFDTQYKEAITYTGRNILT